MAEMATKEKYELQAKNAWFSTSSYLFSVFFTFLVCLFTLAVIGTYYGWLDDVYALNLIKGTFSDRGFSPTDQFLLISPIWMFLYKIVPQVPWYGLSMLVFTFFGIVNMFFFLAHFLKHLSLRRWVVIALFTVLFFLFFAENIILLNFTRTSILLAGSSLLCLAVIPFDVCEKRKRALIYIWFSLLFITGYLIRYDAALFPILFVLACAFILAVPDRKKLVRVLCTVIGVGMLIAMHFIGYQLFKTKDLENHYKKRPYIFNILDANNIRNYKQLAANPMDSMRMYAIFSWYHYDNEQIDIPFLVRLGGKDYFYYTLYTWKKNIREEYDKIRDRRESYVKGLKLTSKFHLINVLNLLAMLAGILLAWGRKTKKGMATRIFLMNLAFFILFFFSTVLTKYEDRVYAPTAILLLMVNITMIFKISEACRVKPTRVFIYILCVALLPLMVLRIKVLHDISSERGQEIKLKAEFMAQLNTRYAGKVFLYDLWSLALLHGTPLKDIALNKNNIHTIYGDSYYQDISAHRDYIDGKICHFDHFVDFYDCVRKKEEVIFVLVDFRANLLEDYFHVLYGRDYKFVPVNESSSVKNITYSFLWHPLHFDLYTLQ